MPAGRPPKHRRSPFGKRLHAIRHRRGLSQVQLAAMVGVTQQAYAGWERCTVALRPESIAQLAAVLRVSADELLGVTIKPNPKAGPPAGARRLLDKLGHLPRAQQRNVLHALDALIAGREIGRRKSRNAA